MSDTQLKTQIPSDYKTLLSKVKITLIEGQERIEAERVKTYWQTGKLIHEHILKHADRAEYGGEVIKRLAKDLNLSSRVLQYCIQFSKTYSRLPIVPGRAQFKWSHYKELITISDDKRRLQFERNAAAKDWTAEELAARIKEDKSEVADTSDEPQVTSDKPLTPLRGELYTYKIVERPTVGVGEDSGLLVDLGFGIFREIEGRLLSAFQKDDIVRSRPTEDAYKFSKTDKTVKDLYTYKAFVERVIDGDTLKVRFDLGFETFTRQTLRLRGLDCPEIRHLARQPEVGEAEGETSPKSISSKKHPKEILAGANEGQAAKAFVQSYIKEAQMIIVRSSRSDKYDRYLADVFIPQGEELDPKTDIYLNNLLLDNGYAVRMD